MSTAMNLLESKQKFAKDLAYFQAELRASRLRIDALIAEAKQG